MIKTNLRIINRNYQYYVFQVDINSKPSEIANKFSDLKLHRINTNPFYLSIEGCFNLETLGSFVLNILESAEEFDINICGILKNENILTNEVYGVAVVDLPQDGVSNFSSTLIVDYPIRGGIKIENDGDIIVTSFISNSAEVVSSGNIHVYGVANGKLIAGVNGNRKSRIFVLKFNAEFVSIGGLYKVLDNKLSPNIQNKSVMLYLDDKNKIIIEPFSI